MTSAHPPQSDAVAARTVLVIEDEPDMLLGLEHNLSFEGYAVRTATTGTEGLASVAEFTPDIVLLDVMLPEMNGFDVLKHIRADHPDLPVIMITAKGMEADKVQGLSLGADDYVTKPFSVAELLARVSAVLRRSAEPVRETKYKFGDVEVDFDKRECRKRGKEIALSFKEFEVLRLLIESGGQTVTREKLLNDVWGADGAELPTSRTVDTHIANLRRKLEGDRERNKYVRTVHKVGYRFVADA